MCSRCMSHYVSLCSTVSLCLNPHSGLLGLSPCLSPSLSLSLPFCIYLALDVALSRALSLPLSPPRTFAPVICIVSLSRLSLPSSLSLGVFLRISVSLYPDVSLYVSLYISVARALAMYMVVSRCRSLCVRVARCRASIVLVFSLYPVCLYMSRPPFLCRLCSAALCIYFSVSLSLCIFLS